VGGLKDELDSRWAVQPLELVGECDRIERAELGVEGVSLRPAQDSSR
jgi:hypothetical protein